MRKLLVPISIIIVLWLASCQKDNFSTDPSIKLNFSADTVLFDTVFTTIGSATRYFKVYNRSRSDINISSVQLAGGTSSPYRMNVDGEATHHARNITLRARDSLFVFVEVTVNPTDQNSPLLIPDSIVFETNGNFQNVKLVSWGQDVHMLRSEVLLTNTIFTADKPYLIIDSLWVLNGVELMIEAGAKLYFHNSAWLLVDGRLTVNGQPDNPVIFQGDRLEPFYKDKPGQWGGIWLSPNSHSNSFNWTEVKNAISGIVILPYANQDFQTLTFNNSIIKNMSYMAIDARGAWIEAGNSLFANSKEVCLSLAGGKYKFTHCTIANYWGQYVSRTGPALLLANYFLYLTIENEVQLVEYGMEETTFSNSIIYGSRSSEISLVNTYYGYQIDAPFSYQFLNSIVKVDNSININDNPSFIDVITDNPKFKEPFKNNFELDTLSPAKDIGLLEFALQFPFDLKNVSRLSDDGPDLGAFERVEETK